MTVVSCYSTGTPYEAEARILSASLKRCGMLHRIVPFESRGDWYANTAEKPRIIRLLRAEIAGPLVWVDADAFVHANCAAYFDELAKRHVDFAAHWFAGPAKGWDRSDVCSCIEGAVCSRPHRLLSGTLFIGDTQGARRLLDAWIARNDELRSRGIVEGGGQKNLWYVLGEMGSLLQEKLPGRFCYVFDKSWAYPLGEPRIIEHTIASRDNRSAVVRKSKARAIRKAELMGTLGNAA